MKNAKWRVEEHIGLLIALLAAGFVAIRVYSISGWNYYTAYVVLQTQGTGSVILGSLLPVTGYLASYVAIVVFVGSAFAKLIGRPLVATVASYVAWGLFLISLAMMPLASALIIGSIAVVGLALVRRDIRKLTEELAEEKDESQRRRKRSREAGRFAKIQVFIFWVLFPVCLLLSNVPWIPSEEFQTKPPTVGYVLSDNGRQIVVLTHQPRGVTQLPSSTPHHFCSRPIDHSAPKWTQWLLAPRSLLDLLSGSSRPPACPPPRIEASRG